MLLHLPVLFLAVVVATGVLVVAASMGVLFASTLGTASLQTQAAEDCPEQSMPTLWALPQPVDLPRVNRAGVAAMRASGVVDDAYWVDVTGTSIQGLPVTIYAREGALAHVHTLTPDHGQTGAWFPDDVATKLGIEPGAVVATSSGALTVAGLYRALSTDPFHLTHLPRYWCNWAGTIVPRLSAAAAFVIADPATLARVARDYQGDTIMVAGLPDVLTGFVTATWYAPLPVGASLDDARRAVVAARRAEAALNRVEPAGTFTPVGRLPEMLTHALAVAPSLPLTDKINRSQRVQHGLTGSVLPISVAAVIVALLPMVGAGESWAARRAREVRLLMTRGVGPLAIGLKAMLEIAPAALIGWAAGFGLSILLVGHLSPTSVFGPGAAARAFGFGAVAVTCGVVLAAGVGALSACEVRPLTTSRWWWRAARYAPCELALVAGGVWAWLAIRSGRGIDYADNVVNVHPLLMTFPLLGLTGVVLLLARGAALTIRRLACLARRLPTAGYLALRRIGGSRAIAVGMLLGVALPCGLLAYGGTLSAGVHDELVRKYQTNVGAPHVLELIGVHDSTANLDGRGTAVVRYADGPTLPDDAPVTVMGIDPQSFSRFAYTDAVQRDLASSLAVGAGLAPSEAAILVHGPENMNPTTVRLGETTLRVRVLAHIDVFPGLRGSYQPMLVVNRAVLANVDPALDRANEAWTTARELGAVSGAIQRDGYSVISEFDAQIRISNSGLLPLTWISGYLRALAEFIGAVAVAGLVFALSARTRRRAVSYVISRRMGLRRQTHVVSLLVELVAIAGVGWTLGTAAGLGAYASLAGSLDLQPQLPPGARFIFPASSTAVAVASVAIVSCLAAVGAHAAAEHTRPADILHLE